MKNSDLILINSDTKRSRSFLFGENNEISEEKIYEFPIFPKKRQSSFNLVYINLIFVFIFLF